MKEIIERVKETFKTENKKTLENLYELVNDMINVYRIQTSETLSRLYDEMSKTSDLNEDLEKLKTKYDLTKKENKSLKDDNKKLHEYLEKSAEILKQINETLLSKRKVNKPSLKDLKLEKMSKVSKETKEKIK